MVAARRGGAQAATRDPKAIDDGLQSCITDTRVTRAISSDEAYKRHETVAAAAAALRRRCAVPAYMQLMKSLDFIVLPLR